MIKSFLTRAGVALAAASLLATSAAIFLVALALALYALVRPFVGPAGAAGIVAAAAAGVILAIGVALAIMARRKPVRATAKAGEPSSKIANLLKDAPVTAIAAAVAAGFLAIRNPRYLGVAIRSFLEGGRTGDRKR